MSAAAEARLRGLAMSHPLEAQPGHTPQRDARVMIVDDSALVRGLIGRWVDAQSGLTVAALAGGGQIALDMLDSARPDIVLLDLEMPDRDGLATLPELVARAPGAAVIVVSARTRRNAEISLRCLSMGAVDYMSKPEVRIDGASCDDFRRELIERLLGLAASLLRPTLPTTSSARPGPGPRGDSRAPEATRAANPCLVIGASTGGPRAITRLLTAIVPWAGGTPILVVQHMPAVFTTVFAAQLSRETGLDVREGRHGERVEPGRVYLAPGGRHMGLGRIPGPDPDLRAATRDDAAPGSITIRLEDGPPRDHCRPAVDVLFADAARRYGPGTVGVLLTGMGRDGTEGARAIVHKGGFVLAQDEATSTVWSMPGSVVQAGLAGAVLPLERLPAAIHAALWRRRA